MHNDDLQTIEHLTREESDRRIRNAVWGLVLISSVTITFTSAFVILWYLLGPTLGMSARVNALLVAVPIASLLTMSGWVMTSFVKTLWRADRESFRRARIGTVARDPLLWVNIGAATFSLWTLVGRLI